MIEKILVTMAMISLIFVVSIIAFDTVQRTDQIIIVDFQDNVDPFAEFGRMMPRSTQIQSIREIDKSQNKYIISVSTRHNRINLLEWIRGDKKVERAESR